ncbi:MAG TPA: NAD-dependent epimerase/dehydratase family protein [Candidatus Aminicenantes bacterium]|nr:NAD-dependent epimerase/dehydratase family protein [Candidatus Aminicenantes bacterium]
MNPSSLSLSGKRVLILGGTGFLGSALAHRLVRDRGHDPALIRIFYLAGSPADSLRDLPGLELRPGDILDAGEVRRAAVRAGSAPLFYASGDAARDLGYAPKRTFRQGVEEMAAYFDENGLFERDGRWEA